VSAPSGWWLSIETSTLGVGRLHVDQRQARHDARDAPDLGPPAQVDEGKRPGLTTDERQKLKDLEKEVKELRRANEILKDASIFFATELDGRPKK
jgi:transposase